MPSTGSPWRGEIIGADRVVPLLDGRERTYVNFDNAASTPALRAVLEAVQKLVPWYASVHRGTGFKSKLSTWAYEMAREKVLEFVGADSSDYVAVFVRNTTEAVNKLAWRMRFQSGDVVISTLMEHHSNDLPWRRTAKVVRLALDEAGRPCFNRLEDLLRRHQGHVRLVAVTGASNVTGIVTPIHEIAELAHRYGAGIFVDAAQLAPHRRIRMSGSGRDDHIDFLAFSAHKMYAPFGSGALVARKDIFRPDDSPFEVGGGTVRIVTTETVYYADPPDSEEAGSPNVLGAVALAAAIEWLVNTGMEKIEEYEDQLASRLWQALADVPGVTLYGPPYSEGAQDRLAVFTFNLEGWPHALLAAVLGYEFGIGVRNGCFCAHPYVKALLNVTPEEEQALIEQLIRGDRSAIPGAVRASLGLYNTEEETAYFAESLRAIATGEHKPKQYRLIPETGEYIPETGEIDFRRYFELRSSGTRA